jgi:NADH-quinone oxidoreductase subunit N
MLQPNDIYALLPLIIIGGAAVLGMLLTAITRNHRLLFILSLLSLATAAWSLVPLQRLVPYNIYPLLTFDPLSIWGLLLLLGAAFCVLLLSYDYFAEREERKEEYYLLFLLATLGGMVLVVSEHFASLFLGLETLTISLYAMIAYLRKREPSDEAGLKYLIMAAASSAFLLFGIALIYASCGEMGFAGIGTWLQQQEEMDVLTGLGFGMVLVGLGFKLALVPFHMWTPDVYQGAPAPVAAFVASLSKGSVVMVLLHLLHDVPLLNYKLFVQLLSWMAILSMVTGNLLALQQRNIKRLLAYSSIAHLGYLLVALLISNNTGQEAVLFYLLGYTITIITAFGVIGLVSPADKDADHIADYRGLAWNRPWLGILLALAMLSLAGIPLTAGFIGKFYVVTAGVSAGKWPLLGTLVVTSVIGLFYYLRVINTLFKTTEARERLPQQTPFTATFCLVLLAVLLVGLGLYPTGMIEWIKMSMP